MGKPYFCVWRFLKEEEFVTEFLKLKDSWIYVKYP